MNSPPRAPFATLIFLFLTLGALLAGPVVVLDPGHGGVDNGARWYGVAEKTLNLDVAKRVERLLKARGIPVVMTRRTDTYVTLDQRAAIANRHAGSIFVSIHFNAHTNRTIKGIETFYVSNRGRNLASAIQRRLARRIRTEDRGCKRHHYAVLTKTRGVAALVECGFISNKWECDRCNTTWFRDILAQEIASGIAAYYNAR